jgi:hypothetical protein
MTLTLRGNESGQRKDLSTLYAGTHLTGLSSAHKIERGKRVPRLAGKEDVPIPSDGDDLRESRGKTWRRVWWRRLRLMGLMQNRQSSCRMTSWIGEPILVRAIAGAVMPRWRSRRRRV